VAFSAIYFKDIHSDTSFSTTNFVKSDFRSRLADENIATIEIIFSQVLNVVGTQQRDNKAEKHFGFSPSLTEACVALCSFLFIYS
jgi:hypothetical protein